MLQLNCSICIRTYTNASNMICYRDRQQIRLIVFDMIIVKPTNAKNNNMKHQEQSGFQFCDCIDTENTNNQPVIVAAAAITLASKLSKVPLQFAIQSSGVKHALTYASTVRRCILFFILILFTITHLLAHTRVFLNVPYYRNALRAKRIKDILLVYSESSWVVILYF